mgnify:CR=1 FL=1
MVGVVVAGAGVAGKRGIAGGADRARWVVPSSQTRNREQHDHIIAYVNPSMYAKSPTFISYKFNSKTIKQN